MFPSRLAVTLPVGVPAPGLTGATDQVAVISCPTTKVAALVIVVVVLAWVTVNVTSADELGKKFESPG